jgi:hypothetical protein
MRRIRMKRDSSRAKRGEEVVPALIVLAAGDPAKE